MTAYPFLVLSTLLNAPPLRLYQPDDDVLTPEQWARQHFGEAQLGDRRRTRRLLRFAAQAAEHPSGSIPQQTQSWADAKAAYRLFDADGVTFTAVASPHWANTRDREPGRYLVVGDTTEIDFSGHDVEGLAPLGNGSGQGFLLHSALVVGADSDAVFGLAGQAVRYRQPAPKGESASQRVKRTDRESKVWCDVIDLVGPAPEGVEWVHVLDRGADNFDIYCRVRQHRTQAVVRASSLHRKILIDQDVEMTVRDYLASLSVAGGYNLGLRARPEQPARTATLEVRYGPLQMPRPRVCSPKAKKEPPVPLWLVVVREPRPPAGQKRIEWVLYTSLAVNNWDDAVRVIGYYEKRWLIEEWHKALKSGCQVEDRQLERAERLEPLVALLGVVAVRLLQLRALARSQPERAALEVVPALYVQVLQVLRQVKPGTAWTVRKFFHEVARLGGFLGRRRDGEPGWQAIWHGWEKLQWLVRGAQAIRELEK